MATDHTCGVPPRRGSTILVNIGSTANNNAALRKIAATSVLSSPRVEDAGFPAASVGVMKRVIGRRQGSSKRVQPVRGPLGGQTRGAIRSIETRRLRAF